jgi:energy-coupling factor transporter ATP-binding protein EcfA2
MRKLTVKNFSVIKDAELEFGKITVLIGPQASGKSLLCKLAYFFHKVVREQLAEALKFAEPVVAAQGRIQNEFSKWFPNTGIRPGEMLLVYVDGDFVVRVGGITRDDGIGSYLLRLSSQIIQSYESVLQNVQRQIAPSGGIVNPIYYAAIFDELDRLSSDKNHDIYSYIPSTRAFFVTPQKAVLGSSGRNDPLTVLFSQDFAFDFANRVPKYGLTHDLTHWIDVESRRILRGEIVVKGNSEVFQASDGRELPLSILSSGTQELLPLVTCLREFVALSAAVATALDLRKAQHRRLFYVEEPEASIFPSSQYDLVRIFTRMTNEPILDASWVITTHSPYILTAFNNLIEAGQVARTKPELKNEVAKIIPEQYWIKEGDFKAYAIEDGVLTSIVAEDTGLVSSNYLDQVSETIGVEFDELLRLGYVEA